MKSRSLSLPSTPVARGPRGLAAKSRRRSSAGTTRSTAIASVHDFNEPDKKSIFRKAGLNKEKGMNVSAGRVFYEKAASRRQRHREVLKQHLEQFDDAKPLGRKFASPKLSRRRTKSGLGSKVGGAASLTMTRHQKHLDKYATNEEDRVASLAVQRFQKIAALNNFGRAPGKGLRGSVPHMIRRTTPFGHPNYKQFQVARPSL